MSKTQLWLWSAARRHHGVDEGEIVEYCVRMQRRALRAFTGCGIHWTIVENVVNPGIFEKLAMLKKAGLFLEVNK